MRVFLDASVFIWAQERPECHSARIVEAALKGRLDPVVDEEVLEEVARYFRERRGRSFAWLYSQQIRRVALVLSPEDCKSELERLEGTLKAADRLHLAAARAAGASMLVAFDSDFVPFPEYRTPREAAKRLGLKAAKTDW